MLGARAALFRIAADRHRREAQALLGENFSGITCSDRWWAYDYLDPKRRFVIGDRDAFRADEALSQPSSLGRA